MRLPRTPSQTIGPYLAVGTTWPDGPFVVPRGTEGAIWIRGRVLDGQGSPVSDALVETWQADADGRFAHPADEGGGGTTFRGFGRCATDAEGRFAILTVKPGPVRAPEGPQAPDGPLAPDGPEAPEGPPHAPHVDVNVFGRGLLVRLVTRIYFADEAAANEADPVLVAIPEAARRTLVAAAAADGYVFDIRLQGDGETVFFDV